MVRIRTQVAFETLLLAKLERQGQRVLRIPEDIPLVMEVTGTAAAARAVVDSLAAKDWIVPIRRGIWAVRSRALTVEVSTLEVVGLVSPDLHLVTAGRALAEHRLSDQSFRSIVVLTEARLRDWEWQGENVKYVKTPPSRIWGTAERSSLAPTRLASEERALLDSLAHPRWGVALAHLVEALDRYLDRTAETDKLALAAARYRNAHLARRLGFLIERLRGEQQALPFRALRGRTKGAVPLNLSVAPERQSNLDSRWGIRFHDIGTLVGER
jgi:predicted transcriptional regulator of viral defense system